MSSSLLEQFITYRIARLHARLNVQAQRILSRHCGLSLTQWRILRLIAEHDKPTASHLTREAWIDKGLFSRGAGQLIERKLVRQRRTSEDGRQRVLSLTAAGKRIYDGMMPIMTERQRRLLSGVSRTQHKALLEAIDKLEAAADDVDIDAANV